jgi:organic radical activating enzyme
MDKKIIRIKNFNNHFYLYWTLTDLCNQECSYCPSNLHSGKFHRDPKFTSEDNISFANKITNLAIQNKKEIFVTISGGEPTLHKQLPQLLEIFKPHGTVELITNGTRGISWWKELSALPTKVVITLHPEYYNINVSNRINQLTDFLTENSVLWRFNLMCLPEKWDVVEEIIKNISERNRRLIIPKIITHMELPGKPVYTYSEEQLNFIKNYPTNLGNFHKDSEPVIGYYSDGSSSSVSTNKLIANNEHHFEGWNCSAGVDSISVKESGNITTGICGVKALGNIAYFTLPEDYIQCTRPSCVCPADITLTKSQ